MSSTSKVAIGDPFLKSGLLPCSCSRSIFCMYLCIYVFAIFPRSQEKIKNSFPRQKKITYTQTPKQTNRKGKSIIKIRG